MVVRRLEMGRLFDAAGIFFGLFPMFHGKSKVGFVLLRLSGGKAVSEGRVKKGGCRLFGQNIGMPTKHPRTEDQTNTKINPPAVVSGESGLIFSLLVSYFNGYRRGKGPAFAKRSGKRRF